MQSTTLNHGVLCQADYWRQVSSNDNPVVEYGNDVEGTAFCTPDQQDPLGSSSWNLQVGQATLYMSAFGHIAQQGPPHLVSAVSLLHALFWYAAQVLSTAQCSHNATSNIHIEAAG